MEKDKIVWGLVIQGPILSFGQGPNNSENGYNSLDTIRRNVEKFEDIVDRIVISTWDDCKIDICDITKSQNVHLVKSKSPRSKIDNRLKQFISTNVGVQFLKKHNYITHILKIRTDQEIDPDLINWLSDYFMLSKKKYPFNSDIQEDRIVFSDYLATTNFYLGDFIFSGTINDLSRFCTLNLNENILHPTIGIDYILKYLKKINSNFVNYFFKTIPLLYQLANKKNIYLENYWHEEFKNKFCVIPIKYFDSIIWRGKILSEVIPNYQNDFRFFDDWEKINFKKLSKYKDIKFLLINNDLVKELLYIFKIRLRLYLKYYFKYN